MTEVHGSSPPALQNGRVIIPITAGLCLILLTVVLKSVLLVPVPQISSDMVLYILIYLGFAIAYPVYSYPEFPSVYSTLVWVAAIVLSTIWIIGIYAF
jgi:hypothetical protein